MAQYRTNGMRRRRCLAGDMTDETYTEAETVARREAALKRAFATPHKPHKAKDEGRAGKAKREPK